MNSKIKQLEALAAMLKDLTAEEATVLRKVAASATDETKVTTVTQVATEGRVAETKRILRDLRERFFILAPGEIKNADSVIGIDANARQALDAQNKLKAIEHSKERAQQWMDDAEKEYAACKRKFLADFGKDPTYAMRWQGKAIIKTQVAYTDKIDFAKSLEKNNGDMFTTCKHFVDYVTDIVINRSIPNFFSTCIISNAAELWEFQVRQSYLSGFDMYWMKALAELAEDTEQADA